MMEQRGVFIRRLANKIPYGDSKYIEIEWREIRLYWMNDLHVFTTQSAKKIFQALGEEGNDYCLSAHWRFFYDKDPAVGLPISREEASLPYSYELFDNMADRFAKWYLESKNSTDFFYVSFTSKLVHLFKNLDHKIHCQLSFRFDDNHELLPSDAIALRDLLVGLAQSGRLVLSANNRYDAMYMYYYTGIQPTYIPSTGSYIEETYNPQSDLILIGPGETLRVRHLFDGSDRRTVARTLRVKHTDCCIRLPKRALLEKTVRMPRHGSYTLRSQQWIVF